MSIKLEKGIVWVEGRKEAFEVEFVEWLEELEGYIFESIEEAKEFESLGGIKAIEDFETFGSYMLEEEPSFISLEEFVPSF